MGRVSCLNAIVFDKDAERERRESDDALLLSLSYKLSIVSISDVLPVIARGGISLVMTSPSFNVSESRDRISERKWERIERDELPDELK